MTDETLPEELDPILAALVEGTTFDATPLVPRPRVVWDITGLGKSCKTDTAVRTTPSPIAYMGNDSGSEGVVDKHQMGVNGLRIIRAIERHAPWMETKSTVDKGDFHDKGITAVPAFDLKAYYRQVLHRFRNNYMTMLGRVRTLVVDTMTELDEIARLAEHGKVTQIKQIHYFPINRLLVELVNAASNSDTNLILLGKGKPEFESKMIEGKEEWRRTGRIGRQRYHDEIDFLVQAFFVARYIDPIRNTTKGMMPLAADPSKMIGPGGVLEPGHFELELIRSRQNPDLVGQIWRDDAINFQLICMEMYPDIDPDAWVDPNPALSLSR